MSRADVIHTMRSYFAPEVSSRAFAASMLRRTKQTIARRLAEQGFVQVELAALLSVVLGDPDVPSDASPREAYVDGGNWFVKCECGGCEFVDPKDLVTICCGCWHSGDGHRFRRVVLPENRAAIEAALLRRPDPVTRGWNPGQTVEDLERENHEHGVA